MMAQFNIDVDSGIIRISQLIYGICPGMSQATLFSRVFVVPVLFREGLVHLKLVRNTPLTCVMRTIIHAQQHDSFQRNRTHNATDSRDYLHILYRVYGHPGHAHITTHPWMIRVIPAPTQHALLNTWHGFAEYILSICIFDIALCTPYVYMVRTSQLLCGFNP